MSLSCGIRIRTQYSPWQAFKIAILSTYLLALLVICERLADVFPIKILQSIISAGALRIVYDVFVTRDKLHCDQR